MSKENNVVWIARDKCGTVYLYTHKPTRVGDEFLADSVFLTSCSYPRRIVPK